MKNFSIVLSTVAVILAAVALIMSSQKRPVSSSVEQVSAALQENPQMVIDALQKYQQEQREAQEKAEAAALAKYAGEINSAENTAFVGPENASVTVVEFFDFSCGYCKRLAPSVEKAIADNADVKFVFKPVSFVSSVSPYQAKAGLAANKQGKFLEFYKAVMAAQGRMTEADVDAIAESLGLDMAKFKADLNSEEVSKSLADIASLTSKIQVNGVPTLFVNGKQVRAISVEQIQEAITAAK